MSAQTLQMGQDCEHLLQAGKLSCCVCDAAVQLIMLGKSLSVHIAGNPYCRTLTEH